MTTTGPAIDLNADLGEGFGHWRLAVVTSANVACGFHAGRRPSAPRCVSG
jgi:UPF0271 protein